MFRLGFVADNVERTLSLRHLIHRPDLEFKRRRSHQMNAWCDPREEVDEVSR